MPRDLPAAALFGLFLLLLALQLALPRLDADQAVTGLMGVHILKGELPLFFWKQDHAGVPESYTAAVTFWLLGVSRLTLGLAPALAAVAYALLLARTASLLFGRGAAALALLYATVVSPYMASHYVLARAYYIEHLLLGQVLFLGAALWLARGPDLSPAARERSLLAMGLAAGLGLYLGFQIAMAVLPAVLALLLVDPRLPLRRAGWMGVAGFVAGSLPFSIYNLTRGGATFATVARFQGGQTPAEAARILLADMVPVILGVQDYMNTPPYLPGWAALTVPVLVTGALGWLALRALVGLPRLRRDPGRAGEAMVVVAVLACLAAVWAGRFHVPRYLIALAPPLALGLARATQLLWARARPLAVALAGLYLVAVGLPLIESLPVLWPASRAEAARIRGADQDLFAFLEARGLTLTYGFEYWEAPRLTFDAAERIIVAQPFNDRYPPYTAKVDATSRPAFVLRTSPDVVAAWLASAAVGTTRTQVGPYVVFSDFTPPPPVAPVPRAGWTVTASPGKGSPAKVTDGSLRSGWASANLPPGGGWLEIDLGQPRTVSGLVLVADRPEHGPTTLVGEFDDGSGGPPVRHGLDTGGVAVAWVNGAPRITPMRSLAVRFPPVTVRRIRLFDLAPTSRWTVAEVFLQSPLPTAAGIVDPESGAAGGASPEPAALRHLRDAMRRHPDDPTAYVTIARLLDASGVTAHSRAEEAAQLASLHLVEDAREAYSAVAANLGPGLIHAELADRRANLAEAAGDRDDAARLRAEADRARHRPAGGEPLFFGRTVALDGVQGPDGPVSPGEPLTIRYRWRLLAPTTRPLTATVHFRGDRYRFGDDHRLPAWLPGLAPGGGGPQTLLDERRLTVPADTPPGVYRLVVGVWDSASQVTLRRYWRGLLPTLDRTAEVATVEVRGP